MKEHQTFLPLIKSHFVVCLEINKEMSICPNRRENILCGTDTLLGLVALIYLTLLEGFFGVTECLGQKHVICLCDESQKCVRTAYAFYARTAYFLILREITKIIRLISSHSV